MWFLLITGKKAWSKQHEGQVKRMDAQGFWKAVIQQQNSRGALEVPTLLLANEAFKCGPMEMGEASLIGEELNKNWQITLHARSKISLF